MDEWKVWIDGMVTEVIGNLRGPKSLNFPVGNFPDEVRKLFSRQKKQLNSDKQVNPGYLEIFQAIRKLSRPSGKYQDYT